MNVLYDVVENIEKIIFDGYAQEMVHSKARNKRFQKSARMLKTNVFESSYDAFLETFLAQYEELKTLSAQI